MLNGNSHDAPPKLECNGPLCGLCLQYTIILPLNQRGGTQWWVEMRQESLLLQNEYNQSGGLRWCRIKQKGRIDDPALIVFMVGVTGIEPVTPAV
jgi:hypothetical protein